MEVSEELPGPDSTDYAGRLSQLYLCEDGGQPKTLTIPLDQILRSENYCCFSYGEQSKAYQHHKVIMLVGATGVGKSTLINTMINYILGVKWEDDFRFKIVDKRVEGPQSQAHSQTQVITSYTIHSNEHHTIPYTLTIIDTPGFGDTRGIERDKAIVHQVKEFFSHPEDHHVDHLDGVGFVANSTAGRLTPTQKYIFWSILSLYGKDIEPNIIILATFSDKGRPQVVSAFKEENIRCEDNLFKFNNSALFECNVAEGGSDSGEEDLAVSHAYWKMGMRNIKSFFKSLDQLEPVSLVLTKEVLCERLRLENTSENMHQQIRAINTKVEQLKKESEAIERHKNDIGRKEGFQITTHISKVERIEAEESAMNCNKCNYTCHYPCSRKRKANYWCRAFDIKGRCTVCPKKCKAHYHDQQFVRIVTRVVKKTETYKDIKKRYEKTTGRDLSVEQVTQELKTDIQNHMQCFVDMNVEACRCMQRLQEIALKPQMSMKEYVDILIENEKRSHVLGWEDRVKAFEQMKSRDEALSQGKAVKFKARVYDIFVKSDT